MKRKLQVFVSSTYTDMLAERQAAVEAILESGHIPAGMELFASGDESQWDTIRRWIDDSDVFLLMLGGRYGSVESKSGKSYIQLEYEYATEKKMPLFAAVIDTVYLDAKVKQGGLAATEQTHPQKLKEFRDAVTSKICKFFNNTDKLKNIIFQSLGIYDRNEALSGWVRGSDVVDPRQVLEQVSQLQAENTELRRQLAEAQSHLTRLAAESNPNVSESLTADAKELLLEAKAGDGHILHIGYLGGAALQAGRRNFIEHADDARERARWKAALDLLLEYQLAEGVGYKGETFRLTHLGYQVADEIEAANPAAQPEAQQPQDG